MQKITPFLWFDNQAEEAANYYVSIFGNSRILKVARYGEAAPPGPKMATWKRGAALSLAPWRPFRAWTRRR
jgi:predicted 3-demethylubiquinone-9 3-methyltransferase (glyoxalase superfamily)